MDDDSKLSFFFLGLGLGVAAGILFAPKSGVETRDFLLSKANDGADYAKRQANDISDYAKRQANDIKETASEQIERGKSTVARHKENLTAAVDAGKQAYREAIRTPIAD